MRDIAARLFAYEASELGDQETLALYRDLIQSGWISELQGRYQREALALVRCGLLSPDGEIQCELYDGEDDDY